MRTARILPALAMGLVLMGTAAMASAKLCRKCSGKMYIMSVGECAECDGHTSSGAHKLCKACSKKLGECEHCRDKLGGGKQADDARNAGNGKADAKKDLAKAGEQIRGKVGDRKLRKLDPDSGVVTDAATLKKLLKKWDYKNPAWTTDFQKNFVVVGTAFGPNIVRLMTKLGDDGNLKVVSAASRMMGPGFGWAMKVVSREGVKTVNGKKLPPPGSSDVRSFRDMDLSRDGSVVHGLWEFRWFLNASTSVSGSLLYAGKPVPFPEKDADPVHQRTPWGMVTHSNVSETSGKWSGGWFPREPDVDQPALLPIPVMLAMGEDLNPHKSGTHKSGGWVYEYTIENRGTWSVKRTGKLTFGGEAVDANVGQWMVTPWGVMQVFDGRNVHGWLPEEALGRSLSLVWSDQIISPPVKRRVRALKTDLDNLAIAVTYRGPDAGHGPDAGRRGCPFSALLHTDDAARSVLYGTQLLKIEPKLAAKLIDAMARSGVLDVATDPRRANIKWPKGPCYMIRVGQTGLGANASYVWNAGWDLTTLDHIRNLARAAGYNKAATVLEKVVQTVPDQEKTKWTRKATRDARMELTSPAFEDGQPIPEQYTGEGKDVSPALKWSNPPEGTEEFALICEDPDAPREEPWVHWVIYGIPKAAQGLPAEMPEKEQLPEGKLQGVNSFGEGQVGYGGPMPPEGHGPHRYIFTLYALDSKLDLKPGLSKQELLRAIDGHAVAETTLTGTYERK